MITCEEGLSAKSGEAIPISRADGDGRFGGEVQKVDGFRGFADARQTVRAATRHVVTQIQRALLRESAQQPQLVQFF